MANAQINVRYVPNTRGGESLVHNNYRYQVKNRNGDKVYWRCHVADCRATVNTFMRIPTKFGHEHNHDQLSDQEIRVGEFIHNVKKRCRDEVLPAPAIYEEEIAKLRTPEWDDDTRMMVEKLPTYNSCKTSLYHQRSKLLPRIPKTRQDINLEGEWTQTTSDEKFLLIDDGNEERMLVFATRQNLEHLVAADVVYGDGTFYTCPDMFTQLYTLHAMVDNVMFPLLFALLPGKSRDIYTRLFRHIRDACEEKQLTFNPRTLFIDYEMAVKGAAELVFPGVEVKGCFFHFTQCIWRKAQQCGLQIPYRENQNIRQLVRRAAVLPLIPPDSVDDVWLNTLEDIWAADVAIDTTSFTDYVTTQWIEGDTNQWNHHATEGPRTTNHLEGWHGKIKKVIHRAHPNIYTLLTLLKQTQAVNEVKLIQYAAGGQPAPKRRRYRTIETRLIHLKARLHDRQITVMEYADDASQLLHL